MANSQSSYTHVLEIDTVKAATDISLAQIASKESCFVSYNPSFKRLLGENAAIELREERSQKFAHEAGVYIKSTDCNYFTSPFQGHGTIEVHEVSHATGKVRAVKFDHVVNPNGACKYKDSILFCSQGDRTTPSALVLVDPKTSESKILLNNFHGREFNSINDVIVHHGRDEIWFTDPTYGYMQDFRPAPKLPIQVYRFKPSTGEVWCVADGFAQCNGLCFSPDYSKMYVTDTGAVQSHVGPGHGNVFSFNARLPATIYVFDVVDGKFLANRRMFAFCDSGIPDGIKCDVEGNVYSGCNGGVFVWNPEGTLISKIWVDHEVPNFNFVSNGMWILAHEKLYFCKMESKGTLVAVECE